MPFWKGDKRTSAWIDELDAPSALPEQAERYHRLRKRLRDDLGRFQKRRLVLAISSQVQRFESRLSNLRSLERDLAPLFAQAQQLSQRVQRVAQEARSLRKLSAPVGKRCDAWFADLSLLGASAGRRSEILQDKARLMQISEQVHLCQECVHTFSEAERLLGRIPSSPEADALRSDLERKQGQIGERPLTQAWLDDLQKLISAVADQAPALPRPPHQAAGSPPEGPAQTQAPAPQQLSELIEQTSRWMRVLDARSPRVAEASRRFRDIRRACSGWQSAQPDHRLEEEVQSILEVVRDEAKQIRRQRRAGLEDCIRHYQCAMGAEAGLEESIQSLVDFPVRSPEEHERWLQMASEAETRFRGLANIRKDALGASLAERLKKLKKRADAFSKRPLFRQERERLMAIKRSLEAIEASDDLDAILEGIAQSGRLEQELEQLQQLAEDQISDVEKQKSLLTAHSQQLLQAARRAGLHSPEAAPIEQLDDPASLESQQQVQALIQDLEGRLEQSERKLTQNCLERMAQLSQDCAEMAAALSGLDQEHHAKIPEMRTGDSSPLTDMVAEVERFEDAKEQAEAAVQQAIGTQLERVGSLRQELGAVLDASGNARERRSGYLDELFGQDFLDQATPLQALSKLRRAVRRGEALCQSFLKDQSAARELMQRLPSRLNELEGRGLKRHLPRHAFRRLTALIEGVSAQPGDWHSARLQLEEAERLLGNLEQHALSVADLPQEEMVS